MVTKEPEVHSDFSCYEIFTFCRLTDCARFANTMRLKKTPKIITKNYYRNDAPPNQSITERFSPGFLASSSFLARFFYIARHGLLPHITDLEKGAYFWILSRVGTCTHMTPQANSVKSPFSAFNFEKNDSI